MIFDIFSTGKDTNYSVMANNEQLMDENGNPLGGLGVFNVMTISAEPRTTGEGMGYTTVNQPSFVCAVGSTEVVKDALLKSTSYGNTDAMLSVLRYLGKDVNPVGLSFLSLYDSQIATAQYMQTDSTTGASSIAPGIITATVILTVLPALTMTVAGVVVLVRRKTRQGGKA